MTEQSTGILTAARDLQSAGQFVEVYTAGPEGLQLATLDGLDGAAGGFRGAGLDSRSLDEGRLFVALPGERADGRRFIGQALAAGHWVLAGCEPGCDVREGLVGTPAEPGSGVLLCRDGAEALAALSSGHRGRWRGRLAAVTGTNGKTTTKDLLAAMLGPGGPVLATAGNYNNHLGVPLTLLDLRAEHRHAVIEMGASAEGEIAFLAGLALPEVGIITNASPAHLEQFGSLDGIIRGKGELLDALPAAGTAVLNADSPGFRRWSERARCRISSWGTGSGDHRWSWEADPHGRSTATIDGVDWSVPLPGRHNGANLTAALLAAVALGADSKAMRAGLKAFTGSAHRGSVLAWRGRTILDDSYNANPGSILAAGRALRELPGDGRCIAVLGAMAELGPDAEEIHRATGAELAAGPVDVMVAVGEQAQALTEGFDAAGKPHHYCATCAEAAAWIIDSSQRGDRLLIKGSRSAAMETILPLLGEGDDR